MVVCGFLVGCGGATQDTSGDGTPSAFASADDKVIGKQLQWEDSVMGADDKRAELDPGS